MFDNIYKTASTLHAWEGHIIGLQKKFLWRWQLIRLLCCR